MKFTIALATPILIEYAPAKAKARVTTILKEAFVPLASKPEFVPDVSPSKFRLFQIADLLYTVELANLKLFGGDHLTDSEFAFFGNIQNLRKNYLKPLSRKHQA